LERDRQALSARRELLTRAGIPHVVIQYEELFEGDADAQYRQIASLLNVLRLSPIDADDFAHGWAPLFDRGTNQWASADVYRRIPGIEHIDQEIGSDDTGRLFT
jgi:hypothetical protein